MAVQHWKHDADLSRTSRNTIICLPRHGHSKIKWQHQDYHQPLSPQRNASETTSSPSNSSRHFSNILQFHFATSLDLNMGYFAMQLDKKSKKIMTVVLLFGIYQCKVPTQGAAPASNFFQGRMESIFSDMKKEKPEWYIYGILHKRAGLFWSTYSF